MTLMEYAQLLGDFSDFFGAIAVVISLIYLAVQVKHSTKSAQISAAQSFAEIDNGFVGVINQSQELPEVLHRGAKGISALEGGDVIRFMAFLDQVFISIHAAYIQWQLGMLDDRLWQTFNQAIIDLLRQPGQREWWELRRHWFEEDFQTYVDNAMTSDLGKPMHPKSLSP